MAQPAAAQLVEGEVRRRPVQPAAVLLRRRVGRGLAPRAHEGLLEEVRRGLPVAHDALQTGRQRPALLVEDDFDLGRGLGHVPVQTREGA